MKDKKIFTIPNILSMLRIIMIPFIVWMFFTERYYISGGLLILSGITDVVDGFIARKFNQISSLGKVLDPIADKLTIFAVVVSLSVYSTVVLALLIIYVVKELIFLTGGIFVIKLTGKTHSSKWYGKATTVFLYLTMFIHILWADIPFEASLVFIIISCVLVCVSLGLYMAYSVKLLKEAGVMVDKKEGSTLLNSEVAATESAEETDEKQGKSPEVEAVEEEINLTDTKQNTTEEKEISDEEGAE